MIPQVQYRKLERKGPNKRTLLGPNLKDVTSSVCEDGSIDELEENNSVELRNSRKKPGRKATWDNDILEDLVSVITESGDYTDKLIIRNTTNVYNSVTYENIIKEVRRPEERGEAYIFQSANSK